MVDFRHDELNDLSIRHLDREKRADELGVSSRPFRDKQSGAPAAMTSTVLSMVVGPLTTYPRALIFHFLQLSSSMANPFDAA